MSKREQPDAPDKEPEVKRPAPGDAAGSNGKSAAVTGCSWGSGTL